MTELVSFQSNSPPAFLHQASPHIVLGVLQDVPVQGPPGDEADRKQDQHGVHVAGREQQRCLM